MEMHNSASSGPNTLLHDSKQSVARLKQVCVFNQTRWRTVATHVSVADTPGSRRRGLLGYPELEEHEGLWIVPCESVHTVGMSYPIDLIYLNKGRRVVKVVESLAPCSVSICLRAYSVIELAAGAVRLSDTMVDHQLAVTSLTRESI
jgi:uncharacterized protein